MSDNVRPIVLIFVLNYLPGFKAGGVLRTVVNTIDWLADTYDFRIVTRDRDLGDTEPYAGVSSDRWESLGGTPIRYLAPAALTGETLVSLITEIAPDLIHLNSYFDPVFTLRLLWARKMGKLAGVPVLLSPRGEFGDGSLKLKYAKKYLYMMVTRWFGLFKGVIWHATSEHELQDIMTALNLGSSPVRVALDLAAKVVPVADLAAAPDGPLRIVFLSRISREKNLEFALRTLQNVQAPVTFDIYGPDEDKQYWKECQAIIAQLPRHIQVTYRGAVSPAEVVRLFGNYDLFFFPSKGENYGHVVAESISAGTRVLMSTATPWHDLASDGIGWDIDLREQSAFVAIIDALANEPLALRAANRKTVMNAALVRLSDPATLAANRALFMPPASQR